MLFDLRLDERQFPRPLGESNHFSRDLIAFIGPPIRGLPIRQALILRLAGLSSQHNVDQMALTAPDERAVEARRGEDQVGFM